MLKIDFHVHIRRFHRLADIRRHLKAIGVDGFAITNFWEIDFARWLQRRLDNALIFVGKEIHSRDGHILGIGLQENVPDFCSAEETVALIHDQGGLAILPHPFLGVASVAPVGRFAHLSVDAIEVFNYRAGPFFWPNSLAWLFTRRKRIPLVANSDAKAIETIGRCYNLVPGRNQAEVFAAVRAGRIQRKTRMLWPTSGWAWRTARQVLFGYQDSICGVCGASLRRGWKRHTLKCVQCGWQVQTHTICSREPHFICKSCRTQRDYSIEAIERYRKEHGLDG
ncbi:MAG: PHP-associated domain-containing protein [candidate division KSB1 bacterium]|nr:PHP-associated domain-containing protein [candidate division KSB1 bacterium]